ncbi:MAG TPA: cytochrome b/b6 domain-containing protein, partial [Rhodanobacter sp.]
MHRIYLHPLPVRIWHWINAATCVLLFLTGIQIRYVGLVNVVSFHVAVTAHSWLGFVLIANFFLWLG